MLRFLPLLALTLPFLAEAAPVPPNAGRPTFGATGLLTRAELEKVKFGPYTGGAKGPPRMEAANAFATPKGFEKAAVAVHLPWNTFREGEPVPAYFVLKNGSADDWALDSFLNTFGPQPAAHGACAVNMFDCATNEPVAVLEHYRSARGRTPALVVPARGFYCVRCDIGRTTEYRPLPPGEYEVDIEYGGLRSAAVRFTVEKNAAGAKPPATVPKNPRIHFYRVATDSERERLPAKVGEPFLWDECRLHRVYTADISAALSVGHAGAFVPDVHTIPSSDARITASVVWKPYRDGDRVVVTLTSRDPNKPVRFVDRPQLHLQVHADSFGDLEEPADEKEADAKALTHDALVTPLTIEVRLPADWRARVGLPSEARLAVVVTSGEIELARHRVQPQKVKDVVKESDTPPWAGIVRTPFTLLRFPPPLTPPTP